MAYPEQGSPMDSHDHPAHNFKDRINLAGDVIDISGNMRNIQESNRITRSLGGQPKLGGPDNVVPHPLNPMGGYGK